MTDSVIISMLLPLPPSDGKPVERPRRDRHDGPRTVLAWLGGLPKRLGGSGALTVKDGRP